MFESIYNTEALLLAVKLKQRFRRESEKLMPAPPPTLPRALGTGARRTPDAGATAGARGWRWVGSLLGKLGGEEAAPRAQAGDLPRERPGSGPEEERAPSPRRREARRRRMAQASACGGEGRRARPRRPWPTSSRDTRDFPLHILCFSTFFRLAETFYVCARACE